MISRGQLQTRDEHLDLASGGIVEAANPATHARPSDATGDQDGDDAAFTETENPQNPSELVGVVSGVTR